MPPALVTPVAGAGPGIEPFPISERATIEERALSRITTYGWTEEITPTVRIPIEEAMRLLIERSDEAGTTEFHTFEEQPAWDLDSSGGRLPEDAVVEQ
jgi:hypothetical protein